MTLTGGGDVFYEAATILTAFVLLGNVGPGQRAAPKREPAESRMAASGLRPGRGERPRRVLDLRPPVASTRPPSSWFPAREWFVPGVRVPDLQCVPAVGARHQRSAPLVDVPTVPEQPQANG